MSLSVGTQVPELQYETGEGETKSVSTPGEETWIIFVPFAFTGVCENELCDIRDNPLSYTADGRNVVIVTCDPSPSQKRWAQELGYKGPWVSDFYPHGEIAQRFDVFNSEHGCANRVSYLIDGSGTIVKVVESASLGEARDFKEYV